MLETGCCQGCYIRGLDITFQKGPDGHLYDRLDARLLVLVDLVQPNIVLAVAGIAQLRHDCERVREVVTFGER